MEILYILIGGVGFLGLFLFIGLLSSGEGVRVYTTRKSSSWEEYYNNYIRPKKK